MPTLGTTLLLVFFAIPSLVGLAYWTGALVMALRFLRAPGLREGERLAAESPSKERVCVVVPAHNESAAIGNVIRTLRTQTHAHMSVLLALDRCTDDTEAKALAAIDGDPRFRIVTISDCPEGWSGKVHALHHAITGSPEAREAELLLLIDADTFFEPTCIAAAAAFLRSRKLELLSLVSVLTHERWFEYIVQPAAAMELMRQFPLERANLSEGRRPFANGQFLLFDSAAYRAIGGHERVREEMLEDLAFARIMAEEGRPAGVIFSDGLLHCRMYPTWAHFSKGWKRIYTEAVKLKVSRLRGYALRARLFGTVLPLSAAALALLALIEPGLGALRWPALGLGAASMLAFLAASAVVCAGGRTPLIAAPAMVVGHWMVGGLLLDAARILAENKPVKWGGREYVRPSR